MRWGSIWRHYLDICAGQHSFEWLAAAHGDSLDMSGTESAKRLQVDFVSLTCSGSQTGPSFCALISFVGVMHFVSKEPSKIRLVTLNAAAQRMIEDYLALTGHRSDVEGALFGPVKNNRTCCLDRHLGPVSILKTAVKINRNSRSHDA